jgi:galactokinase
MTGAGFGGCTVSLVKESGIREFVAHLCERYPASTGLQAECFVSTPCRGAEAWRI